HRFGQSGAKAPHSKEAPNLKDCKISRLTLIYAAHVNLSPIIFIFIPYAPDRYEKCFEPSTT
ncbi:MAG TPA: hypothetical protein VF290_02250, partial [Pyrinomonadaceae bacterium]